MPSILRSGRYRRDQRQLDEEEEMWFNEEDDFEDGEAGVPADLLTKKMDTELDTLGKIMSKKTETTNGAKLTSIPTAGTKAANAINNNPSTVSGPNSPTSNEPKPSSIFKKVGKYFHNFLFILKN